MLGASDLNSQYLQTIQDGLFFIVGPHRSGTTLLQAMLSSHSGLTIPPETGYFDQVWPRQSALGSLTAPANLEAVGRFVNGPQCAVSDLQLNWSEVTTALGQTSGSYADLFVALLAVYARQRGKRRAGEKSPRHLFAIPELSELYPQAKFLCLIRDPRAVVRSERATTWGSKSVLRITRRWCRVVDAAKKCQGTLSSDRFRIVRYEDLIADPESILSSICQFLGEPFEPQMLRFHERTAAERGFRTDEVWKQNTLQAVDTSRVEQWRTELSPGQIHLIEQRAGSRLARHGYALSNQRVTTWNVTSSWITDHCRWAFEILRGIFRGRSRRRPWSSVWAELFRNARLK